MSSYDNPPTYKESNDQYKTFSTNLKNDFFKATKGPDVICAGKSFIIGDFIPWSDNFPCEDLGYLLLRANNWLQDNPLYDVVKCEMIPRMINSNKKLEISNCYIFNMTYGRRYFVNQLRLHIKVQKMKESVDQICLQTIIPDIIPGKSNFQENFIRLIELRCFNPIPKFQDISGLLTKLNDYIQDSTITGRIINISSFYLNIVQCILKADTHYRDEVMYYEEADQGKCHLKCLRVFYKPGTTLNMRIGIKSFMASKELVTTLDDLTYSAISWINNKKQHVISMETFQEYSLKNNEKQNLDSLMSTFILFNKTSTIIKRDIINIFYLFGMKSPSKSFQIIDRSTEIIWITPRKYKNVYETYYSFLCYVRYVIDRYDEYIIDMESLFIQNPLSWSSIRHQTIERYYSEDATNYQIFTIKLVVTAGKVAMPLEGAPLPSISSTKYSEVCSII